MLSSAGNLQGFTVCTVHCSFELLQGSPLGAVAPPDREPQAGYGGSRVHKTKDGDAFQCKLACDGWPYSAPNRATLALGDPPRSLNASGESLGYLPGRGAQGFAPWVGLERFPEPAGAAVMCGQVSGRRSDPPHHRGNIEEVSYLAAGGERGNRAPRRHNQSMESGPGGYRGGCAVAKGGSGVAAGTGLGKLAGGEVAGGGLAAATALLGG